MLLLFFLFTQNFNSYSEDTDINNFPLSYNFFDDFPECDFGNIDSLCNGSYAFSVIKAISHRICRKLRKPFILSSTYISKCDVMNDVCYGGSQVGTYKFLERNGVPNNKCQPWPEEIKLNKHLKQTTLANSNIKINNPLKKQLYKYFDVDSSSIPEEIENLFLQDYNDDEVFKQDLQLLQNYFETHPSESFDSESFSQFLQRLPMHPNHLKSPSNDDSQDTEIFTDQFYENFTRYSYSFCQKCQDSEMNMKLYKTKLNSTRRLLTIDDMKTAIIQRGPITVTVLSDKAFKAYTSGIFTSNMPITAEVGDYTIELIGWGSILSDDDSLIGSDFIGKQYWIGLDNRVNNRFNGQIKILMGSNEILIEDFAYEAEPIL